MHADTTDDAVRLEGVVSADAREGLYAFSLAERPRTWPVGRIGLPGLDDALTYRVDAVFPGSPLCGAQPPWLATGAVLSGRTIRAIGLELPSLDPDRSVLLRVHAV